MREYAVEDIAEKPDEKHGAKAAYRVLYDGQCEICQACVSWLKTLDRNSKTICLPISAEVLSAVDSRLGIDECLRQLHVVTPEGEIHVGWGAVTCLARLFPSLGSLACWVSGSHFAMQEGCSMDSLPQTDIPSANVVAARAVLQNQRRYAGKQD